MRAHYELSSFDDVSGRSAGHRLALAGGSDQPPPGRDETSAEIIRFPLERVRPDRGDRQEPAPDGDDPSAVDASPAETGALWAAWLTSVLSSGTGLNHGRYLAGDDVGGGAGT